MKTKIVFFDCDDVLTFGNPWWNMDKKLGMPMDLEQQWFDDYYNGKFSFKKWNDTAQSYYLKNKLTKFFYISELKKFTINPEAFPLIKFLKDKQIKTAIISSGLDFYVNLTAKKLGIDYTRANYSFIFDKNGKFNKLKYDYEDPIAKTFHIKEICQILKVKPVESIYVGDDINDLEAFKLTKHGLLYKKSHRLLERFCWKKIDNLNEIKKLI